MVRLSQTACDRAGFDTDVEAPVALPDGRTDYIDLLAKRGDLTLAIEVETTDRYVVTNARKAAALGLTLWIVTANPAMRRRVQAKLKRHCPEIEKAIRFPLATQLPQALTQLMGIKFPRKYPRKYPRKFPPGSAGNGNKTPSNPRNEAHQSAKPTTDQHRQQQIKKAKYEPDTHA